MNTMNIPGFTAEDSLYKTSGHYRTGRPAFTSLTQAIRAFHPAAEVIVVYGCPPGYTLWEAGGEWGCTLVEPPVGGGGEGPMPSGGGGGGGGGTPRPKPKPRPTPEEVAKAREVGRCRARCQSAHTGDVMKCAFDPHPDICSSIADNVFSRCKTRCQDEPYHNAPLL